MNSSQARNLPGRPKTGKEDTRWIARLTEMGLAMLQLFPGHELGACQVDRDRLFEALK